MSSRKQEIVKQAIILFNEKGFYNVSLKEIAKAMEISPGNITYHFPKKEDLLRVIQEQLIEEVSMEIMPQEEVINLAHLEKLYKRFYQNQRKYSFYFNNLLYIFKAFPEITQAYRVVTEKRLAEGRKLIQYFIHTERLIPEEEGIDYEVLLKSHWMLTVFWTGQAVVLGNLADTSAEAQMKFLWALMFPYFTEKGREEYRALQLSKQALHIQ